MSLFEGTLAFCFFVLVVALLFYGMVTRGFGISRNSRGKNGRASMHQPVYIYALKNRRERFYVGRSINPDRRLRQHIESARRRGSKKERYIYKMLRRGREPRIEILAVARDERKARALERKYIHRYGETNVKMR